MTELFSLQGKVACVTGAGRGIGRGIALGLARAGAAVVCAGSRSMDKVRAVVAEIESAGGKALAVQADVSTPEGCESLIQACLEQMGGLDILVNNAGTTQRAAAEDMTLEQYQDVMDVNARAVFLLMQAAGRHMLEQGSGKIINIASMLSFQGGIRCASYAASKGAVASLTRAFANEWASRGVNVNAIAPGYIATDLTQIIKDDPDRNPSILARIPAGRWGRPEDLQGAAVFLASQASDYVHGEILCVDGGWMAR